MRPSNGLRTIVTTIGCCVSWWLAATPAVAQRIGPELSIDINTGGVQLQPSISSDASGRFVAVWADYGQDGFQYGVIGRRFGAAGNPLGGEFQVNSYTTGSQHDPSVSSDDEGNFVVVWTGLWGQDGSESGVFGQRFDETGLPLGGEFPVNSFTTGAQLRPAVASGALGNFVVVWDSYQLDEIDVFAQIYDADGDPVGGEFQANAQTTGTQSHPAVATDAAGNFVVAWQDSDGSSVGVFARRFDSMGSPVGTEFQVNTYTTFSQAYPAIAGDASGGFVVVWQSSHQDGSESGVFGQRFDAAGQPAGVEFQVNTYTASHQRYPAVAMTDSGRFVVAWDSAYQDGWAGGIFAQAFDVSADAVGDEFAVNSHTTGGQQAPAVAADRAGTFVATWESSSPDPAYDGIRGQLIGISAFVDGFESGDVCAWSDSSGGGTCP